MPRFEAVFSVGWEYPPSWAIAEAILKKNISGRNITNFYPDKLLVVECEKRPVDLRGWGIRWMEVKE